MLRTLLAALAIITGLIGLPHARGQSLPKAIETSYIWPEAQAALVTFPQATLQHPSFELMPLEVLEAAGQKEMGVNPLDIVSAVACFEVRELPNDIDGGVVVRFSKPVDKEAIFARLAERGQKEEIAGQTAYVFPGPFGPAYAIPAPNVVLVAHPSTLPKMLAAAQGAKSTLIARLQGVKPTAHASLVADIVALRPFIQAQLAKLGEVPPPFVEFTRIPALTKFLEVDLAIVESGLQSDLRLVGNDEAAAKQLERTIEYGLKLGKSFADTEIAKLPQEEGDVVAAAMQQYSLRLNNVVWAALKPTRTGDTLTLDRRFDSIAGVATATALLLPAVQATRTTARRVVSMNNLRNLLLAMLNYETSRRGLPDDIRDKAGKPLLSWRVAILPYLDQQVLYDRFKLDEPWDSPHNRELLQYMPRTYGSPNAPNTVFTTPYLRPVGKHCFFGADRKRLDFAAISDGSSQTILVVEADPAAAVPWTKPADLPIDLDRPRTNLGSAFPGGFNAVFADGHAEFIPNSFPEAELRKLFTPAGSKELQEEPVRERN